MYEIKVRKRFLRPAIYILSYIWPVNKKVCPPLFYRIRGLSERNRRTEVAFVFILVFLPQILISFFPPRETKTSWRGFNCLIHTNFLSDKNIWRNVRHLKQQSDPYFKVFHESSTKMMLINILKRWTNNIIHTRSKWKRFFCVTLKSRWHLLFAYAFFVFTLKLRWLLLFAHAFSKYIRSCLRWSLWARPKMITLTEW